MLGAVEHSISLHGNLVVPPADRIKLRLLQEIHRVFSQENTVACGTKDIGKNYFSTGQAREFNSHSSFVVVQKVVHDRSKLAFVPAKPDIRFEPSSG